MESSFEESSIYSNQLWSESRFPTMMEKKTDVQENKCHVAEKGLAQRWIKRRGQSPSDAKLDRKPSVSRGDEDSDVEWIWYPLLLNFIAFLISKSIGLALEFESERMSSRCLKNCLNVNLPTIKGGRWKDGEAIFAARASVPSGEPIVARFLNVGSVDGDQGRVSGPYFPPLNRTSGDAEFIGNRMADWRGWEDVSAAGWGLLCGDWDIGRGDGHRSTLSRNFSAERCKSVLDTNNWKSFRRRNWVSSRLSSDKEMPPIYEQVSFSTSNSISGCRCKGYWPWNISNSYKIYHRRVCLQRCTPRWWGGGRWRSWWQMGDWQRPGTASTCGQSRPIATG